MGQGAAPVNFSKSYFEGVVEEINFLSLDVIVVSCP
jgi:hypothetical protein